MICNASLKQIGDMLSEARSILIFPHVNADGDAVGSAAALCRALRNMGKDAWVMMNEEVSSYLSFMDTQFCTTDTDCVANPDICVCVDCAETKRFPNSAGKYNEGKMKLCIDHHASDKGFGDYYYIDGDASAAAQIIYELLNEMQVNFDRNIVNSLYTGIITDTGNFKHANTTPQIHEIAADLMAKGVDHMEIMINLYQKVNLNSIKLQAQILDRMQIFAEGKAAAAYVTEDMLEATGTTLEDAEGVADVLRSLDGVEIAAFFKDKGDSIKASLRSKSYANVDGIAAKFDGGGHVKAAGCTLHMSMQEALEALKKEIIDYLEN